MIGKTEWAIIKTKIVGEIDHFPFEPRQNLIKHFNIHQVPFYLLIHQHNPGYLKNI